MSDKPSLEERFEMGVSLAEETLRAVVVDGQLYTDAGDYTQKLLWHELGFKNSPDEHGPFLEYPEGTEGILHRLSPSNRGAYDLYAFVVASRIVRGLPLNRDMRLFCARNLTGTADVPRHSRKKSKHFSAHCQIYTTVLILVHIFRLSKTENDTGPGLSACHAISQALENLGHHKTPKAIKDICTSKSNHHIRSAVEKFNKDVMEAAGDDTEWDRPYASKIPQVLRDWDE
ncbi:hypothetical protein [Pseudooceanicola nitratireducens]|uniref:hypothetical protein n=1 Tax=Pseudooceanicola nitratireducens TaxID=517719 RepID=UPI001C94DFB3|nr:hypothetical protein [Pseudooceanicola nitratireducens]MBY6158896.1 hypothetical protein [Pseudooceanicola nitratireducens]